MTDIDIKVSYCNKYQIAYIDNNQILHCENALCNSYCSLNGQCIANENNVNNNPNKNDCECNPGYKGKFCENKNIVDYRYIFLNYIYIYIYIYII